MQYTNGLTLGGTVWPSILLVTSDQEKALVLWGNTTLGLLLHWWHANKQQSGRGRIPVTGLKTLRVLDVTALTSDQLRRAVALFDVMKTKAMLPVSKITVDPVRRELDERFVTEVLGLPSQLSSEQGPLGLLRRKFGAEPSILGATAEESTEE